MSEDEAWSFITSAMHEIVVSAGIRCPSMVTFGEIRQIYEEKLQGNDCSLRWEVVEHKLTV